MAVLFQRGFLNDFLAALTGESLSRVEKLSENEILTRPVEDLVEELIPFVYVEPLAIGDEAIDGSVTETTLQRGIDAPPDPLGRFGRVRAYRIEAVYAYTGDARLFDYRPSNFLHVTLEATITAHDHRVAITQLQSDEDPGHAKQLLDQQIGRIRQMATHASQDAASYNARLDSSIHQAVEERKERVMKRRGLAGALGFPLTKRPDAPRPVPLQRRQITTPTRQRSASPYRDEPALSDAQYEEAIAVVRSTLLAMERSPSVASSKTEEELRDQILVQLNGSFRGSATGETFIQAGKTDILLRVEDRHVFVAECKWWDGQKACKEAVDQLLSYLPWRDEKAALLLFIDRRDATAAIEAADQSIRAHAAFKRPGVAATEPAGRRNYVLGQPDDLDREIKLAALFAVLPREKRTGRRRSTPARGV